MKKLLWLFIFSLLLPSLAMADGGLIPPPNRYVYETDQKAVIFFEDEIETLVISTKFQGDAENFAWIIPTPNQPEVEKSSAELFNSLFELTQTTQDIDYGGRLNLGLEYAATSDYAPPVKVLETKQIEYYDITVLKAIDEEALNEWLNENGYKFPSSANYVLDHYIENGWYFTAIKISGEYLSDNLNRTTRSGDLIPLSLTFATDKIVFPLKISSVDYFYKEDEGELDFYINRYKPIYDYFIDTNYRLNNLPQTWQEDAYEISKVNRTLRNRLFNDLLDNKSYLGSIGYIVDFINEDIYNEILTYYNSLLDTLNSNQDGSIQFSGNVSNQINIKFPELDEDYQNLTKIQSKTKKTPSPVRSNPNIQLMIYIIADEVYEYSNFDVQYANWIEDDELKNLASNDQGEPWIEPAEDKYALTKLYKNMRQSEMTNDLYFKESDIKLSSFGPPSAVGFYIFIIIMALVTSALGIILIYIYKKH